MARRRSGPEAQWPVAVGSEQTRPSPTSRGLGCFVSFRMRRQGGRRRQAREQEPAACEGGRWATLPCPAGARGRCRRAGSTLFAPAGQKRFRVGAPDFGLSRGKVVCRALCPSGMIGRRAGEEERSGLRSMKPLRFSRHPAGSTAGSARTRSRDQSLENPFLGTVRSPKNAAGGRPLLVGLPPSAPTTAPTEPKRRAPAPCSWGGCASTRSRRRWLPTPSAWEFNLPAPLQMPTSSYNIGRNALKGTASAFPLSKRAGAGASPAEGCGGDHPGAAGRTLLPVGRAGSARYSAGAFLRAASGRFAPTWVVPR